jgi:hypothetical protein
VEFGFPGQWRAIKSPLNQAVSYDGGVKTDFQSEDPSFSFSGAVKAVRKVLKFEKTNVTINGIAASWHFPARARSASLTFISGPCHDGLNHSMSGSLRCAPRAGSGF